MKLLLTADPELPVPPDLYGGIERIIAQLIIEFRKRGVEVGLVANETSSADVDKFYAWPGKQSRNAVDVVKNIQAMRQAYTNFRPEIVHSYSRLFYLLGIATTKTPRLMSYQREPTGRTIRTSRFIHRQFLQFTGCSDYICQAGRERGGGVWHSIHNFVDPEKFEPLPIAPKDAPLVFLSRIEPIKGAHLAIEIAKRAQRHLIIAGNQVKTGAHANYFEESIAPHLRLGEVEYIGPVNDIQKNELLRTAAAMIVPIQWNEPFGIVFIESLACGTPVIACPRGALPEIVVPGRHGFLISSVDEGVEAINRIDEIDRGECRRHAVEQFSSSVIAERYLSVYQSMLS